MEAKVGHSRRQPTLPCCQNRLGFRVIKERQICAPCHRLTRFSIRWFLCFRGLRKESLEGIFSDGSRCSKWNIPIDARRLTSDRADSFSQLDRTLSNVIAAEEGDFKWLTNGPHWFWTPLISGEIIALRARDSVLIVNSIIDSEWPRDSFLLSLRPMKYFGHFYGSNSLFKSKSPLFNVQRNCRTGHACYHIVDISHDENRDWREMLPWPFKSWIEGKCCHTDSNHKTCRRPFSER
jgi:hypothetical protein